MGILLHFFFSLIFCVLTNNSTTALRVLLLTTLVVVDRAPRLGLVKFAALHSAAASARDALAFLDVPRLMTNGGAGVKGGGAGAVGVFPGAEGVGAGAVGVGAGGVGGCPEGVGVLAGAEVVLAKAVGVLAQAVGDRFEGEGVVAVESQVGGADIPDATSGHRVDIAVSYISKRDHHIYLCSNELQALQRVRLLKWGRQSD